ncbi:PAS domain S-box protein [Nostoc punctiforme]|uniref:PAS domain S-box protein n=1 Tax=Nostoc punctiforme TaxID=272131 RepID=UPI000038CDBD|nr:PAS domain S-box protein [Nostoc punctiforme]
MILKNSFSELQTSKFAMLPLEEELLFNRFLMERLTDAVFWITSNAQIIYVNYAACSLVGYPYEELVSRTIHNIILDFPLEVWPNYWNSIKQQGFLYFESLYKTLKGQYFSVEISATYMEYEAKEYVCILIRDISKRKQALFSLDKSNQVLECKEEKFLSESRYVNQQLFHKRAECEAEKVKLENSLSLLQATLESIADGVIAIRYNGDIISSNQNFPRCGIFKILLLLYPIIINI